jgi:glycosyltransferase involved in cell wall biosynthesis
VARILYISYTGLLEPLGQSQVLQYLVGLSENHEIELISFEKPPQFADLDQRLARSSELAKAGIRWHPMKYHKRFSLLATAYDLVCMLRKALQRDRKKPFDIVHCRSYIAGIAGAVLKKCRGTNFIFDMRGFWADERVDGGIWKAGGLLYRGAKKLERWLLLNSDYVVSLTHAGVIEIERFPYMQDVNLRSAVIPTCTNLFLFQPKRAARSENNALTIGMVGSVGTWYLLDHMLHCVARIFATNTDARLLVLNKSDHALIWKKLAGLGISDDRVEIASANYSEVADYIGRIDFGLFFIKPVFSKKASAPTKLGEFLACGVPCLTNAGVGDVDTILRHSRTGICLEEFSSEAYDTAYQQMMELLQEEGLSERCRQTAEQYFSLEQGIAEYDRIYRELSL